MFPGGEGSLFKLKRHLVFPGDVLISKLVQKESTGSK